VVEPPELRGPSREQVYRRRLVALILVVVVVGAGVWAAWSALKRHGRAAPPVTTVAAPKQLRITFPEGFTLNEMAAAAHAASPRITARGYLAATVRAQVPPGFGRPSSREGFLFPDTYFVFDTDPAVALVEKQLEDFRARWARVDLRYARSKHLTPYDVLKIASMIEREAVVESERPLIAAVIYNRLRAGMPLGIDATLRYALDIPGTQSITERDLASTSPYNTRRYRGLPPTPICNPGLQSIQAAAHPARVDYLYFVAKPDKRHHFFTASFAAFNAYKATHGYR
jgi:peptidoglycan lytic transglycosylase G